MPGKDVLLWLTGLSMLIFITSLIALPWLVARIPADYFSHQRREPASWKQAHPAMRRTSILLKNILGCVLLAGGLMMIFIPGQGILTMATGLILLDYPGKYALERRIVAVPFILRGLNWLRKTRHVPPLKVEKRRK